MSADLLLDRDSPLYRTLAEAVEGRRCVFVAGLPGVGKSLLIQQLTLIAAEAGRGVHLLQWDVARGPFETPDILALYPEIDGITHPAIRKAAGLWVRQAVANWDRHHPGEADLLIGELPLIGSRLIEIVQQQGDAVEPLLAGPRSVFLVPVPAAGLRQAIERARAREMDTPRHERERANANLGVMQALWGEVIEVAERMGVPHEQTSAGYDPDTYAAVYVRLLHRREKRLLPLANLLPVRGSPYDVAAVASELLPTPLEVEQAIRAVEALPPGELERQVERWYIT
jgi:hypothetical protein